MLVRLGLFLIPPLFFAAGRHLSVQQLASKNGVLWPEPREQITFRARNVARKSGHPIQARAPGVRREFWRRSYKWDGHVPVPRLLRSVLRELRLGESLMV